MSREHPAEAPRLTIAKDFPPPSMGAPVPSLQYRSQGTCVLSYITSATAGDGEVIATFDACWSARVGVPSEDGFDQHRLAPFGFRHGIFDVANSDLVAEILDRYVSPARHDDVRDRLRHIAVGCHDESIELVFEKVTVEHHVGDLSSYSSETIDAGPLPKGEPQ